jgi:hypothetical protein
LAHFGTHVSFGHTRAMLDQESEARLQHWQAVERGPGPTGRFLSSHRVGPAAAVFAVLGLAVLVLLLAWRSSRPRAAQLDAPRPSEPVPTALPPMPNDIPAPPQNAEPVEPPAATQTRAASVREHPPQGALKSPVRTSAAPKRRQLDPVVGEVAVSSPPPSSHELSAPATRKAATSVFAERN